MFKELFTESAEIPEVNRNGDCYQSSYRYFDRNHYKDKNLRLVHGLVSGQGALEGVVYNHAWCESGNKIIDLTLPKQMQKSLSIKDYYKIGKIKTTYKYNHQEVLEKVLDIGTYGPWESKLLRSKY